jgi:prepilin-type N-terminal cleavage/methylation domain-containing protein
MLVKRNKTLGFTLIELLVVISIIALLLSIIMPALSKAKESAKRTICTARQKQWGLAYTLYATDYKDWFPYGSWGGGFYVQVEAVKYFQNDKQSAVNTGTGAVTIDQKWWDTWMGCPSNKYKQAKGYVAHFWSGSRTDGKGVPLVHGEYMYFGGHGNFGVNGEIGGEYDSFGWASSYFLNGHKPSPKTTVSQASSRVLMCDVAVFTMFRGQRTSSSNPFLKTNHEAPNAKPIGINSLYSDGHVQWLRDPWNSQKLDRFIGGWGTISW